jgi:hypothetical protein
MTNGTIRICWITSNDDRTEHAVSDEAQEASRALGAGVFQALCGVRLLSASMDVGPSGHCATCQAFWAARTKEDELDNWTVRQYRPGLWTWLVSCLPVRSRGRHAA